VDERDPSAVRVNLRPSAVRVFLASHAFCSFLLLVAYLLLALLAPHAAILRAGRLLLLPVWLALATVAAGAAAGLSQVICVGALTPCGLHMPLWGEKRWMRWNGLLWVTHMPLTPFVGVLGKLTNGIWGALLLPAPWLIKDMDTVRSGMRSMIERLPEDLSPAARRLVRLYGDVPTK